MHTDSNSSRWNTYRRPPSPPPPPLPPPPPVSGEWMGMHAHTDRWGADITRASVGNEGETMMFALYSVYRMTTIIEIWRSRFFASDDRFRLRRWQLVVIFVESSLTSEPGVGGSVHLSYELNNDGFRNLSDHMETEHSYFTCGLTDHVSEVGWTRGAIDSSDFFHSVQLVLGFS